MPSLPYILNRTGMWDGHTDAHTDMGKTWLAMEA